MGIKKRFNRPFSRRDLVKRFHLTQRAAGLIAKWFSTVQERERLTEDIIQKLIEDIKKSSLKTVLEFEKALNKTKEKYNSTVIY
jgi:hypothetical protein